MYRATYWSCSKFADKIRGTKKPFATTWEEWDEWRDTAKSNHPIRFWIAEKGLDKIQDIIMSPSDFCYSIKYYVVNRWIDKSYALVSHPKNIKRGDYADLDSRIFYCLFDELVDYVEIDKAYSNFRWDSEKQKGMKWWQVGKWRLRTYRNKDAGIDYLKWEMTVDEPSHQAKSAKEIYDLYTWYTEVFPNRPDPYDVSGWSAYCDDKEKRGISFMQDDPEDDKWDVTGMLKKQSEIEQQYNDEDTEMLIRLIKVRGSLWS